MRVVLVGNYGDGNMGDEALRAYFERSFSSFSWNVVTVHPHHSNELPRLPGGIRSFFAFRWMSTIFSIARADALVFGGGTLFADHESVHACFLWYAYIFCARFFRVPIALSFQGVGPFRTFIGRTIAGLAYRSASFISVRDDVSYERVVAFRPVVEVIRTIDPVFPSLLSLHSSSSDPHPSSVLAIIPRFNATPSFFTTLSSFLQERSFSSVHLVCLQDVDALVRDRVQSCLPSSLPLRTTFCHSVEDILHALSDVSTVYTQRYHGALAALFLQKETIIIPQMTGDKLDALQHSSLSLASQMALYHKGEGELRAWLCHHAS